MFFFLLRKSYCFIILSIAYVGASSLKRWVSVWMIPAFHLGVNTDACRSVCRLCVSEYPRLLPAPPIFLQLVCVVGFRQQLLKQHPWLWVYPGLPSSWPTCQVDTEHVARCAWSMKSLMVPRHPGVNRQELLFVTACSQLYRHSQGL